ncbi:MAG: single-stranded DNA-binding protein [Patescibacteria group bacterium]|nr:single-stranded DNA-binding protein [Patescibacteria group bacterium]
MYLNKAFIIGNLTRDPELKALPSGTKVASFGMATNRVYKDKDGNRQEAAEFHNIVTFGRQAELCAQYLKKGSQAYVEGRLQTRSWEQEGQKKYRTEIVADTVQFGSRGGASPAPSGKPGAKSDAPSKDEPAASGEPIQYPQEEINPDDIPF